MNFRIADKKELIICTKVVKDAFDEYEFFNMFIEHPQKRKAYFEVLMEVWMKNCFQYGTVLVGTENDEIVSVAVLNAPDDKEIDFIDCSIKTIKLFCIGGIKNTKRFLKMCETSDEACHVLPNPKWHLVLLAVAKKYSGKGIGSLMLQNCIIPYVSKHGGRLLTFNTNAEVNRSFYKKNGFEEFDISTLYENGKELGNWSYKMNL